MNEPIGITAIPENAESAGSHAIVTRTYNHPAIPPKSGFFSFQDEGYDQQHSIWFSAEEEPDLWVLTCLCHAKVKAHHRRRSRSRVETKGGAVAQCFHAQVLRHGQVLLSRRIQDFSSSRDEAI